MLFQNFLNLPSFCVGVSDMRGHQSHKLTQYVLKLKIVNNYI